MTASPPDGSPAKRLPNRVLNELEATHISVVHKYFDGCNAGDVDVLLSTLTHDVVHYFLAPQFSPIRGAEHLARHWCKFKAALDPIWSIDRILAQGQEVVSEWSCIWTPRTTQRRIIMRGSEWYVMRDTRIAEVRAYFIANDAANTELTDFPYSERDYLKFPAQ